MHRPSGVYTTNMSHFLYVSKHLPWAPYLNMNKLKTQCEDASCFYSKITKPHLRCSQMKEQMQGRGTTLVWFHMCVCGFVQAAVTLPQQENKSQESAVFVYCITQILLTQSTLQWKSHEAVFSYCKSTIFYLQTTAAVCHFLLYWEPVVISERQGYLCHLKQECCR